MLDILVSFDVTGADDKALPAVAGTVRRLGPDGGVTAQDTPETASGLPFSGWLQLLGHLERLTAAPRSVDNAR